MSEQSVNQANSETPKTRQISGKQMEGLFRSAAFGEIVGILMRAPKHKMLTLDALRISVMPPLLHNQYMIARPPQTSEGRASSGGVALWASVSDEVDKRLRANDGQRLRLTHEEWKSGPHLWLVDIIAPSNLAASLLKELDEKVAKGRPMAAQIVSGDNKVQVATVKDLLARVVKEGS